LLDVRLLFSSALFARLSPGVDWQRSKRTGCASGVA